MLEEPKKRGRKPKEKSYYIVKNEKNTDIQSDNIILHRSSIENISMFV